MIRTLRRSDKPAIRKLGGHIFREKDEIPLLQKALRTCISSLSYVIIEEGELIGFTLVGTMPTQVYFPFLATLPNGYELAFLGISPQCQGRGLGTRLLKETLNAIFQRSKQFICWLICDIANVGAMKLYQKWGFRTWKETTEFPLEERGYIMGLHHRRYQSNNISIA
jgi:ribosomal protein S18 acetylase RimI-like enzyme